MRERMNETPSIGGRTLAGVGQASRSFPNGRVRSRQGCDTQLSVSNDGQHCSRHLVRAMSRRGLGSPAWSSSVPSQHRARVEGAP